MVSGTGKRLKVVWLCHLNNEFISQQLGVESSFEFAPWISRFADLFGEYNEVDVHIVAPYGRVFRLRTFSKNNIHYHFFPYHVPFIPKRTTNWLHRNSNYVWNKLIVRNIINRIKPDLIHLFGTENAYFTSTIFQFKNKYPILITIQGFAKFVLGTSNEVTKRKLVEQKTIKTFNNYGVRDEEMKDLIRTLNPKANFFHHEIAPYVPKVRTVIDSEKEFDIIFFARVVKSKGIEDLINSLVDVKKDFNNISLAVVGPVTKNYLHYLIELRDNKGLTDNIHFFGSQKSIVDVHKILAKSRITVLPTYADTIPGTIIESMYMGVPCISYPVGGIPTLNKETLTIKLVDIGDIKSLSKEIITLLKSEELRCNLSTNAKEYVNQRWDGKLIMDSILIIYRNLICTFSNS